MSHAVVAAATTPRAARSIRVLRIGPELEEGRGADALVRFLAPGDLVVVNDAATLPASLPVRTTTGDAVELRLASPPDGACEAQAVLFGAGDHRTPTERRPPPPVVRVGEELRGRRLRVTVREVSSISPRLVRVRLEGGPDAALADLWREGMPVQYAYVPSPVALWDVWNAWASEPWAVEMPSAARVLDVEAIRALRTRGVELATVTHAAGLSDTGDPAIDARLPFPERTRVTTATVDAVRRARARGGRVVAAGTSVVRALETAGLAPFDGVTDVRIGPGTRRRVVDALLTGVHADGTSHHALLEAFASRATLEAAMRASVTRGFLGHEHGDAWLLFAPLDAATATL